VRGIGQLAPFHFFFNPQKIGNNTGGLCNFGMTFDSTFLASCTQPGNFVSDVANFLSFTHFDFEFV